MRFPLIKDSEEFENHTNEHCLNTLEFVYQQWTVSTYLANKTHNISKGLYIFYLNFLNNQ